jgi:hypothetical protein
MAIHLRAAGVGPNALVTLGLSVFLVIEWIGGKRQDRENPPPATGTALLFKRTTRSRLVENLAPIGCGALILITLLFRFSGQVEDGRSVSSVRSLLFTRGSFSSELLITSIVCLLLVQLLLLLGWRYLVWSSLGRPLHPHQNTLSTILDGAARALTRGVLVGGLILAIFPWSLFPDAKPLASQTVPLFLGLLAYSFIFYSAWNPDVTTNPVRSVVRATEVFRDIATILTFLILLATTFFLEWWVVNLHCHVLGPDLHAARISSQSAGVVPGQRVLRDRRGISMSEFCNPYDTVEAQGDSAVAVIRRFDAARPDSALTERDRRILEELSTTSRTKVGMLPFLPLVGIAMLVTVIFGVSVVAPVRLLAVILNDVRDSPERFRFRYRHLTLYRDKYIEGVFSANPLLILSTTVLLGCLVGLPVVLAMLGRPDRLALFVGPDQLLASLAITSTVLSPFAYRAARPAQTYSEFFKIQLANAIVTMRKHLVVIGYTDISLGVLRTAQWRELSRIQPIREGVQRGQKRSNPREVAELFVSPDLDLEVLSLTMVLVDEDVRSYTFAYEDEILGRYGVVELSQISDRDSGEASRYERQDWYVAVLQGNATEPYVISRVNLDHARFVVSTVPDPYDAKSAIIQIHEARKPGIVSIPRAFDMNRLVHLTADRPVSLVYSKHSTGLVVGQRLLLAVEYLLADYDRNGVSGFPRIMVIGRDASNFYMLDVLAYYYAGHRFGPGMRIWDYCRALLFLKDAPWTHPSHERYPPMLRVDPSGSVWFHPTGRQVRRAWRADSSTSAEFSGEYGRPPDGGEFQGRLGGKGDGAVRLGATQFTDVWPMAWFTDARPRRADRILSVPLRTAVLAQGEYGRIEGCLAEFWPDIIIVNDESPSQTTPLMTETVRAIKRLQARCDGLENPKLITNPTIEPDIAESEKDYYRLMLNHFDRNAPTPYIENEDTVGRITAMMMAWDEASGTAAQ